MSPEAAGPGLCTDVEPLLGLFAGQTLVGSTGGGFGGRVSSGLWSVGKERPEEAAGSWLLVYFGQIPFGRSRQLWQLSDGGFAVEFVFVLTADPCPTVSPPHGNAPGSCRDKTLSRAPRAVPGYLLQSHVCQSV